MTGGDWLETTWRGGSNSGGAAAFAQPARVRRTASGSVVGEWWDDGRPAGLLSKPAPQGPTPQRGRWVPFVTNAIPLALIEQAEREQAARLAGAGEVVP
jgi:hypothetical protein